MWRSRKIVALSLLFAVLALFASGQQGQQRGQQAKSRQPASVSRNHGKQVLTRAELQAVVQAVQDEIYDYGYEREYYVIGDNLGTSAHWVSRVPLYINPEMNDGVGQAIYKLMPYGEVFRGMLTSPMSPMEVPPEIRSLLPAGSTVYILEHTRISPG